MDRDWMLFWKGSFLHIILPPYFHKGLLALQNSGIKHYTFLVSETAAGWLSKTCRTWWGHKRPRPLGWGCSVTSEEPMKAEVQKESKGCLLSPMALHFSSLLLSTCSCSRNPSVPLNSVSLHVQSQKSYIKKAEHNKKIQEETQQKPPFSPSDVSFAFCRLCQLLGIHLAGGQQEDHLFVTERGAGFSGRAGGRNEQVVWTEGTERAVSK